MKVADCKSTDGVIPKEGFARPHPPILLLEGPIHQSIFWYDNDKELKVRFLVTCLISVGTIHICEIQAAAFTALTALEKLYLYNNDISHSKYDISRSKVETIWICGVSLVGIYSYKLAPDGRIQIIVIKDTSYV